MKRVTDREHALEKEEIAVMSRAVAQHFGLWTPRQMCNYGDVRCRHFDEPLADTWDELTQGKFKPHEIPCPDLTQPEWAWRLLELTCADIYKRDKWWAQVPNLKAQPDARWPIPPVSGDNPREALLLAVYQLVQREAAK